MQIFATSDCPLECAHYLDDKRVVKMVLETAQLLSNVIHIHGGIGPYRLTHRHHPCTKWAAGDIRNYYWLLKHFEALCTEYKNRYRRVHKCEGLMSDFMAFLNDKRSDVSDRIPRPEHFVNCASHHKDVECPHEAYILELELKWMQDIRRPTWYGEEKQFVK